MSELERMIERLHAAAELARKRLLDVVRNGDGEPEDVEAFEALDRALKAVSTCWSGHPDYVERLEAEIEQLRARNKEHEARYEALEALGLRHDRAAVIEECAKVADAIGGGWGELIAAAIRALKDKP